MYMYNISCIVKSAACLKRKMSLMYYENKILIVAFNFTELN